MYGWLWRHLPGPTWVRVIIVLVLLAAITAALFTWVFPEISPYMPFNETTVG